MFCEKCGKSNPEGAVACEACGAPLNASAPTGGGINLPGGLNLGDLQKYIKPALAVVAVIIVLFMFKGCLFGGAEKPIKNMIKYTETGKFKHLKKTMPKALVKAYDDKLDDVEEMLEKAWESEFEEGKPRVSYKVEDKDKLDKDELEDIEESIEAQLKALDADDDDVKVTKGYEYELEITTKYDGDKETEDETITVVKVDGKWCLADF